MHCITNGELQNQDTITNAKWTFSTESWKNSGFDDAKRLVLFFLYRRLEPSLAQQAQLCGWEGAADAERDAPLDGADKLIPCLG